MLYVDLCDGDLGCIDFSAFLSQFKIGTIPCKSRYHNKILLQYDGEKKIQTGTFTTFTCKSALVIGIFMAPRCSACFFMRIELHDLEVQSKCLSFTSPWKAVRWKNVAILVSKTIWKLNYRCSQGHIPPLYNLQKQVISLTLKPPVQLLPC